MVTTAQSFKQPPEILVVDDQPSVTAALARLLEHSGYRVTCCYTAAEALQYAQTRAPAAAVIDIHLPDMCGLTLSRHLRQRFGDHGCPIIVLSGDTSIENLRRLPEVGANYFLSKPFKSDHLVERLRELAV